MLFICHTEFCGLDYYYYCTNAANENCDEFCVKEVFKCRERRMMQQDEEWTKAQAWGCPLDTPRNIQEVQASKLGDARGTPSSSTKKHQVIFQYAIFLLLHILCVILGVSLFLLCVLFCFVYCSIKLDPIIFCFGERHTLF